MIRPILVATLGFLIGIIIGLYLNSMVLFYCAVATILIYILARTKLKRYFRYVKLILNFKVIIVLLIFAALGFCYVTKKERDYQEIYDNYGQIEAEGVILSDKIEKEYSNMYEIKIEGKKFYCYISKKQKNEIEYGDKVIIKGKYEKPSSERNKKGFDYSKYLKTKNIYGRIDVSKIEVKSKNTVNLIMRLANDIRNKIKQNSTCIENKDVRSIYLALVLGDTSEIENDLKQDFRDSSLAHILAVSGMHVSYLVVGCLAIFKNFFGKRKANIITCFIIFLYILITGMSSSVSRAGIMTILVLGSRIFYRKNDLPTSISLSLFILLIFNPFSILDVGLQFSYMGTIGIILFQKPIASVIKKLEIKDKKLKYKIPKAIEHIAIRAADIIAVTISAQITILPISLFYFNLFSSYLLILNFLISIVIGPAFIIGIVFSFMMFINAKAAVFVGWMLEKIIGIIIEISRIPRYLFGSKIYFPTPTLVQIIIFYIIAFLVLYHIKLKNKESLNATQKRIKDLYALFKFRINQIDKRVKILSILLIMALTITLKVIPKDLKINFIDVGQGDSTFITTPKNKTILIDGGGVEGDSFDVGKMIVMPYILKRRIL